MLGTVKRGIDLARIAIAAKKLRQTDDPQQRLIAQKALASMFSNSRGVALKIGQLFAQDDASPFRDLLDHVDPFPLEQILPVLEKNLGRAATDIFDSLDESHAAASLGQVHRGVLKSGELVAVKIQYPDIAQAVASEMTLAGLLPGFGPVKKWGFELESYKQELKQNMERELDYRNEAQRQERFSQNVMVAGLVVPKVYPEYCSAEVLVQSWEEGVSVEQAAQWSSQERQEAARILLKTLFRSMFVAGEIHGDPHMGNYFFRKTKTGKPEVVLLDYGCTVPVPEHARFALFKLIDSLRNEEDISPLQCFCAMGFDVQKLSYIDHALPMLSRVLLRPFLIDGKFRARDWRIQHDMETLLGEHKWWFRSAGPANLFLLIRAFQGLVQHLEKLQGFQDWWALLVETCGPEFVARARAFELPPLPGSFTNAMRVTAIAKTLKVKVWERNRDLVAVNMPAEAVLDIENIIPVDVMEKLKQSGNVNLETVMEAVRSSGIRPQLLFDYEDGPKRYRVWLE